MVYRPVEGARLVLPGPVLAWCCIVLGVVVIAVATAGLVRARAAMWGETRSWTQALWNVNRGTMNYLLHDYDGEDRVGLLLLGSARFPAALAILWGVLGLAFA